METTYFIKELLVIQLKNQSTTSKLQTDSRISEFQFNYNVLITRLLIVYNDNLIFFPIDLHVLHSLQVPISTRRQAFRFSCTPDCYNQRFLFPA